MRIRIGHLSTFYHTAVLLMSRTDLEDRLGAQVSWRLFGTGPAIMEAFGRDELDLAYIGLPPAMIGIAAGTPAVCVAGGHMEGTVLSAGADRKDLSDLGSAAAVLLQFTGERIGVPGRGSIHDVILRDLLDREGMARQVEVVNFPWADLVTEAMAGGGVAAALGTPALAVAVARYARGKVLLPAPALWPDNPSYGIIAHRRSLERHREMLVRFLGLHEEASAQLRTTPRAAAELIARQVGIVDGDFVLETLKLSPRYCAQLTNAYIASTMRFVGAMQRLGYLRRALTEEEVFDRSLMQSVHPGPDHYSDSIRFS